MILDYNYLFDGTASANGALSAASIGTTGGSTINSTNIIDLVNARDMGIGDSPALKVMVLCVAAFTSTGAATLQIKLQGSTDNTTYSTYAETPAMIASSFAAGSKLAVFDWPGVSPDGLSLPRYLRLTYSTGVSTISAGTAISGIVLGRDDQNKGVYPPGIVVTN